MIKKIIKNFIRKTDWRVKKIYRNKSYINSHPKLELLSAMHDCKGIIHMGAHRGTEAAVYDWFNKRTAWIEANPEIIDDLKDHTSQYINQIVIQALLSDEDNKLENFNISSNDGASSSIFSFGSYKKIHEEIKMIEIIKLKTSKLDTVIKKKKINIEKYDFWVLDLQGAELLALKGARESIKFCNYIFTEISKEDIYKNGANWSELNQFLIKNQFLPAWEPKEIHTDVLFIKKRDNIY
jgi:FkbM family methyltransferase